jgi:phi13 family phage major tail protein
MAENKVRFNLKNVHYAILTDGATPTWSTPVAVPGAVSLDLSPEGETSPFYADGIVYYNSIANNGYSGTLEMARIPDQMMQEVWGDTLGSTSKVLTENANVNPASFALLYQIDGDADEEYYCLYNVSGTRPNIGSQTNEETKEPQTQSFDINAIPLSDGRVLARTTADTPSATKSAWFGSVFVEA